MSKVKVLASFTWILFPRSFEMIKSITDFTIGTFKVKEVLEGDIGGEKEIVCKGKLLPKSKDEVGV